MTLLRRHHASTPRACAGLRPLFVGLVVAACGDDGFSSEGASSTSSSSSGGSTSSSGGAGGVGAGGDGGGGTTPSGSGASSSSGGASSSGGNGAMGGAGGSGGGGSGGGGSGAQGGSGGGEIPPLEEGELSPGGDTTVEIVGNATNAFVMPAANLTILENGDFEAGSQFFQLTWLAAPSTPQLDGLGPTFNASACRECHVANGRGLVGSPNAPSVGVLLRLGDDARAPDPTYGNQFQPRGLPGIAGEGVVRFDLDVTSVLLGSASVDLSKPTYRVEQLAFGPLALTTQISPRIGQQLVGMGLLEAIDFTDLAALEDPEDLDGDGISGRLAWLDDGSLGRFGWKAASPTVETQTAAAFAGDLGITSALHPTENCPAPQIACAAAPHGGSPEVSATTLHVTSSYVRLLGVPSRKNGDSEPVLRGKKVFRDLGCAGCHQPSHMTGGSVEVELSVQKIWPYTDLLLHDMGDGLSDGLPEGAALANEWRTPPLWGLGRILDVNGGRRLMHDGRAGSLDEAILWHGGEAEASRLAFEALDEDEREQLRAFLESL